MQSNEATLIFFCVSSLLQTIKEQFPGDDKCDVPWVLLSAVYISFLRDTCF